MGVSPDEVQRRLRERTGLIRLGHCSQADAFTALRRSLPRTVDAVRLVELVEQRLGERAIRDFWVFPNERALLLRDDCHPGWWLPRRLLYLDLDRHVPPEPEGEIDDWFGPEPVDTVLPLATPAPPARLRIDVGPAHWDATFDDRGRIDQIVASIGDPYGSGQADAPFLYDPLGKPPLPPPLALLTREDLDPTGHAVDELAEWVAELRPDEAERGRVWVPVPTPGSVAGAWTRGLWNLRLAAWHGELGPAAGFAVADAFNGAAVATGETFDAAVAAWRALVARVQPLPPVEREVELPEPAPPTSEVDPETGVTTSEFTFVWYPPVKMAWPEPRPENVPAVAVPLEAAPELPAAFAARGWSRVVRLFGEHGEGGFVFVRDDSDGFTVVGDSAATVVDPDTLDAELDALDRVQQAEYLEMPFFAERAPWDDPKYPVQVANYLAWDPSGRHPDLRRAGGAWSEAFTVHLWESALRYGVQRIRFVRGEPAVRRPD